MKSAQLLALLAFTLPSIAAVRNCYTCNSAEDPDCDGEYDKMSWKKFESDCSTQEAAPKTPGTWTPVGCRKILQEVNGVFRTVRQCAYGGDNVDGFKRTGNEGVRMWFYQCSDGNFCNSGPATVASLTLLLSTAFTALFL
jgi:hypothetical protein